MLTNEDGEISDYSKYRGKCKLMSEELCANDSSLKLTKGYYLCPCWGKQEHWWCVADNGTIIDPTKDQFPSKGAGEYVEFDGNYTCANCDELVNEADVKYTAGRYVFCSNTCLTGYML